MSFRLPFTVDVVAAWSSDPAAGLSAGDWFDTLEPVYAACSAEAWLADQQWLAATEVTTAVALMACDAVADVEVNLEQPSAVVAESGALELRSDPAIAVVATLSASGADRSPAFAAVLPKDPHSNRDSVNVASAEEATLTPVDDDDIPPMPRLTLRRFAAAVGGLLGLAAVTAVAIAPASDVVQPPVRLVLEQVALSAEAADLDRKASPALRISQSEVVNRGETASSLLSRLGANDPELIRFIGTDRVGKRLLQLQAGRTVTAEIDEAGVVHRLQYRHGSLEIDGRPPLRITIARQAGKLSASEEPVAIDRVIEARAAEVRTTLFAATDAAGIPDSIATRAADILGNSIDLRKDLRRGAELRVVYETLREVDSLDLPIPGRVLAIELVSGKVRHEAVWFEHDDGKGAYYNFAGQNLVRSFLREPIEYTRITSGFSGARLHPLFQDVRAHTGTDFAAPVGTKVRSVADGIVDFAGYNGGYGRTVIVSHAGKITTLYAHLNTFGDGIVKGARVSQGQIVGTVGMTGWTTGPHLHYEFRIAGRFVDPMRAVLPEGRKLSMGERLRFAPLADAYREHMAQIDAVAGSTSVARFE